jgi:hypothetical protein
MTAHHGLLRTKQKRERRSLSPLLSLLDDKLRVIFEVQRCIKKEVSKKKKREEAMAAMAAHINVLEGQLKLKRSPEEVTTLEEYLIEAYQYISRQSALVESLQHQTCMLQDMVHGVSKDCD